MTAQVASPSPSPTVAAGPLLGLAGDIEPAVISRFLAEPAWLLDDRRAAEALARELPGESNSLFTGYHDLRAVRFGELTGYERSGEAATVASELPEGAAGFVHIRENAVVARALSSAATAAGVVLDTFTNVLRRDPALLRGLIEGGVTLPADDRFAQVSRAAFVAGLVLRVPDGVHVDGPIVIRWSSGAPGRALIGRTIIALGRGASASVLEEQAPAGTASAHSADLGQATAPPADGLQGLYMGTTEVVLGEGATLDFAGEENIGPSAVVFVNRHSRLDTGASLRWSLATIGGAFVKSRIDNVLAGRGSSVRQAEIGFGSGSQFFDLTSYTHHLGQDTTGDLLSKGVFLGQSRGYFKGLIRIERSARGTDSFLGEFAMLLAKKARSVAIPSLEIDQPDVRRAAHSSSVGPIDDSQVFYLMSRGLSREIARKFIVLGFLEPVVARIPLPGAQDRLRELLDAKWDAAAGGVTSLGGAPFA
jgi:Fe-S cluster assembly protein SufB